MLVARHFMPGVMLCLCLLGCDDGGAEPTDVSEACPAGCPASECLPEGAGCALERCTLEGECPPDFYCDAEIGYCRAGCELGGLCTDGRVCTGDPMRPGSRFCTHCDSQRLTCPSGAGICIDGRCVACTEDAQCGLGSGRICAHNNQCVTGCRGEENCPTDQRCDLTKARCVECFDDTHCGTGTCDLEQGVCQP